MKKIISLVVCLILIFSAVVPSSAKDAEITIIACSDFQPKESHEEGAKEVEAIISAMKNDSITSADALFCVGDYSNKYGAEASKQGIAALKNAASGITKRFVLTQGNHDGTPAEVPDLAKSGKNDTEHYGVYVINEDDYMWNNTDEATIKNTAAALRAYLADKADEGYKKPIFVLSHLPLHYSKRTGEHGDAMYSSYIFNELNEAGEKGLNIIYLFGHNHNSGYDEYLGGSSIFLTRGDSLTIAKNSMLEKESKPLSFTYMNAGYIGYYDRVNSETDKALTMSVFKITGEKVIVLRYDKNGKHNLKASGNTIEFDRTAGVNADQKIYKAPFLQNGSKNQKYAVLSEKDAEWLSGDKKGLAIKTDAPSYAVNSVRINMATLSEDEFTVSGNPAVITISSKYLETLPDGKVAAITLLFVDGEAKCSVKKLVEEIADEPDTESKTESVVSEIPAESKNEQTSEVTPSSDAEKTESQQTESEQTESASDEQDVIIENVEQEDSPYLLWSIVGGAGIVLLAVIITLIIALKKKK